MMCEKSIENDGDGRALNHNRKQEVPRKNIKFVGGCGNPRKQPRRVSAGKTRKGIRKGAQCKTLRKILCENLLSVQTSNFSGRGLRSGTRLVQRQ